MVADAYQLQPQVTYAFAQTVTLAEIVKHLLICAQLTHVSMVALVHLTHLVNYISFSIPIEVFFIKFLISK
jgi:hypothetical protein